MSKENAIEKYEYKGYTISIHIDETPQNPRTEWDNFGKMVCFHRRYDLGDKHNLNKDQFSSWDEVKEYLIKEEKAAVILPLYLYDHSGITMSTTPFLCRWDSGQVGFIYATREGIQKEYNITNITQKTHKKVANLLTSEVKTYDRYLIGEVYGYEITDNEEEFIDYCLGFFCDIKYVKSEAEAGVDYYHTEKIKNEGQQTKLYI